MIDVSAPLPPHMQCTWNLLGFDVSDYDRETDDPECVSKSLKQGAQAASFNMTASILFDKSVGSAVVTSAVKSPWIGALRTFL